MFGIGHVAGESDDAGAGGERGDRSVEPVGAAGVDHERVALVGQGLGEREPEPLGSAGDDGDGGSGGPELCHGGLLDRWC